MALRSALAVSTAISPPAAVPPISALPGPSRPPKAISPSGLGEVISAHSAALVYLAHEARFLAHGFRRSPDASPVQVLLLLARSFDAARSQLHALADGLPDPVDPAAQPAHP